MQQQPSAFVVYPSRAGLLGFAARKAFVLALGVVLILIRDLRPAYSQFAVIFGIVACLVSLGTLLGCLYRLVVPRPSLIVNEEGITDNASVLICGVGLIRWSEIQSLYPIDYQRGPVFTWLNFKDRFLMITPLDLLALLAASSPLVRNLRGLLRFVIWSPPGVSIPHWMLSRPVGDVTVDIRKYYEALRGSSHSTHTYPPISIPW